MSFTPACFIVTLIGIWIINFNGHLSIDVPDNKRQWDQLIELEESSKGESDCPPGTYLWEGSCIEKRGIANAPPNCPPDKVRVNGTCLPQELIANVLRIVRVLTTLFPKERSYNAQKCPKCTCNSIYLEETDEDNKIIGWRATSIFL